MNSPITPPPAHPDEINIMDASVKLVQFIGKHLIWVILFPLLGFLGGYFRDFAKGPVYKGQLMIRSRVLAADELMFLVSNYQKASYPGLSPENRNHLLSLNFTAKSVEPYVFGIVDCVTNDTALFDKLSNALKHQIENEPSVRATSKNKYDINAALINQYSATIRKAELLLERTNEPVLNYKNPNTLSDLIELYEKRKLLQIEQRDSAAVDIVSDFHPQELGIEKAKSLLMGTAAGILVCVAFLFILYFIQYYRKATAS